MVELRWHRPVSGDPAGGLAFTFKDGVSVVLQYRYRLPSHPGFRMVSDPITGAAADPDKWSWWLTVGEEPPLEPVNLGGDAA